MESPTDPADVLYDVLTHHGVMDPWQALILEHVNAPVQIEGERGKYYVNLKDFKAFKEGLDKRGEAIEEMYFTCRWFDFLCACVGAPNKRTTDVIKLQFN